SDGQDAEEQLETEAGAGTSSAVDEYPFAVYINYGETAAQIAQKLLDGGIINDKNEFYDALIAAKAERKLLAGSFVIPRGSAPADIVRILTGG
ncbi:MAG: endolytic transglycosylase MltG, partial [Clostridiales Family XIII bacterium]|nr:endolytic transglycosylase MltG [Clostridiales Family XIII bacterium]